MKRIQKHLYTGRVIAALATDPNRIQRNGQVLTTAEVARYNLFDERGKQPKGKRNPTMYREVI